MAPKPSATPSPRSRPCPNSCGGRSSAWDQGAEMARHADLRIDHGLPVYFCDPQSPWQRGTNENTNGLLETASTFPRAPISASTAPMFSRPWPLQHSDRRHENAGMTTTAEALAAAILSTPSMSRKATTEFQTARAADEYRGSRSKAQKRIPMSRPQLRRQRTRWRASSTRSRSSAFITVFTPRGADARRRLFAYIEDSTIHAACIPR